MDTPKIIDPDPDDYRALKRDAGRLASRLGWTVGQREVYRAHAQPRRFATWLALRTWLARICEDIDTARARRARQP